MVINSLHVCHVAISNDNWRPNKQRWDSDWSKHVHIHIKLLSNWLITLYLCVNCSSTEGSDITCKRSKIIRKYSSNVEMYSRSKKKRNIPIYFNTNYHTEMKLVSIIMDYCLLQFDENFSYGSVYMGGLNLTLIFSM